MTACLSSIAESSPLRTRKRQLSNQLTPFLFHFPDPWFTWNSNRWWTRAACQLMTLCWPADRQTGCQLDWCLSVSLAWLFDLSGMCTEDRRPPLLRQKERGEVKKYTFQELPRKVKIPRKFHVHRWITLSCYKLWMRDPFFKFPVANVFFFNTSNAYAFAFSFKR